jgi:HlyD family secretion protein
MRTFIILAIFGGLATGGWFYFRDDKDSTPQYQTAPVARGDLTQSVTAVGTLNPVLNVQVGSQISGIIQKLSADFNSEVKKGQVIAELDPATFQATVHQAEGELGSAQAALALAEISAKRQRDLTEQKIGTPAALDAAEAVLKQAQATVTIRTAQLEKAKVDLGRCTIYSPIDGVVISRDVDVGQTVAASLSAPLIFKIANDLRKMQIDTNVAEADVGNVELGQKVTFEVDAFQGRTFRGKVVQVRNAPLTVQNVVTYITVIEVNNDDLKLKPGMTANVTIVINEKKEVLKLPNGALRFRPPDAKKEGPGGGSSNNGSAPVAAGAAPGGPTTAAAPGTPGADGPRAGGPGRGERRGGGPGGGGPRRREPGGPIERTVYTLVNGQPHPVKVKLGITDSIYTEVLEGLNENDVVITGMTSPEGTPEATQARPGGGSSNPFGGGRGMRRF